MSEQIQYNYYSTIATKIGDNTYIFRGKRNMPNLVLQNSDSYISTKLTIQPSEGTVEIEHEPITNYNKRVITTFPISPNINIQIGESKEITLNSIIPKSLRFDMDDSNDVIYLYPIKYSETTEGFCNSKDCKRIQDQLNRVNSRITEQDSNRQGGNMSDDDYAALAKRLAAMNGSGGAGGDGSGGGGADGSELVCTPISDSEDMAMNIVGITVPLSANDMARAAENSVYHQAGVNVVMFVGGFFILSSIVSSLYNKLAYMLTSEVMLVAVEMIIYSTLIGVILTIYLALIVKPKPDETPKEKSEREQSNLRWIYVAISLTFLILIFAYLTYSARKDIYNAEKLKGAGGIQTYKNIFGDRDCYNLLTYFSKGVFGLKSIYETYVIGPPDKPSKPT